MSIGAGISGVIVLILIPVSVIYSKVLGKGVEQKQPQLFFYFKQYSNELPEVLAITAIVMGAVLGTAWLIDYFIPTCLAIIITMGIYYVIMLVLLSFLRGCISSTLITSLWVMPNVLYIFLYFNHGINSPSFVLYIPPVVYWSILGIWFTGFVLVFLVRVISHLRFRDKILKRMSTEDNEEIVELWERVKESIPRLPRQLSLYRSPDIKSPLSIGILNIFVVLPEIDYTQDELKWIFLHELTHISRRDCSTKLYLAFCNALFWFFPPCWKLISKVSEDLELSCDEMVLLQNPKGNQKEYAALILDTAACEKGFTTCLSSTGACISYRLKQILHPVKQNIVGETIVAMLACVFLLLICGRIQVSHEVDVLSNLIFSEDYSALSMPPASQNEDSEENMSSIYDGPLSDVLCYLNSEKGYTIVGSERFSASDKYIYLESDEAYYSLEFRDHQLCVHKIDLNGNVTDHYFYLKTNKWKELI